MTKVVKRMSLVEYEEKLNARGLSLDGMFTPDPVPMAPPIGYVKQPSMMERIREMIATAAYENALKEQEDPSAQEDFDVDDEPPLPFSPYEYTEEEEASVIEAYQEIMRRRKLEAGGPSKPPASSSPAEVPGAAAAAPGSADPPMTANITGLDK